jgi:polygalacturonase
MPPRSWARVRHAILLEGLTSCALISASLFWTAHSARAAGRCAPAPKSPLVVNVKDKGAKGDGKTDDTASIQTAIDAVAGAGGTVLVPAGVYMIDAVAKPRLSLKDN